MPRGGSKKGERRGGAKKRGDFATRFKPGHKSPGRPKGATDLARRHDPEVSRILNHRTMSPAQREQQMETYFLVTGQRLRMPREVMLDAMRYFENTAIEYHDVLQQNLNLAGAEPDETRRQIYEQHVVAAEGRMRDNLALAVDVAYKVAPFVHPRLAAVVTNPGSDAKNPMNVLALLMQEIDEAGKPPRFIDHDANE